MFLLVLVGSMPTLSSATTVTVNDACGSSVAGSVGGAVNVDSRGDLSISGFASAPYMAGVGQCDAIPSSDRPKCMLSASHTAIEPGASVTLFAKCRTAADRPITGYSWSGPDGQCRARRVQLRVHGHRHCVETTINSLPATCSLIARATVPADGSTGFPTM